MGKQEYYIFRVWRFSLAELPLFKIEMHFCYACVFVCVNVKY